ncbi:MAG: gliding motility protein GldN [Marinifilaceae bacterium]
MKRLIILLLFTSSVLVGFSQTTSGYAAVFKKKIIENRKPIPYQGVREADVIWAKLLWREINLGEKVNLPLYFPKEPLDGRYSLVDLLLKGIKEQTIIAFDTDDDEFQVPIGYDAIQKKFGAGTKMVELEQPDGSIINKEVVTDAITSEVKKVLVKELWYFDKQSSTMQVRIIGLCPVRIYKKENNPDELQMKLFWINYNDCRKNLVQQEVYNNRNDALRLSFDDVFIRRRFSSIVMKESNVYNNRSIGSYAKGVDAMIESDRIKNEMFNWEQDLWHY